MRTSFQCSANLANLASVRHFVRENAQQVCADEDFLYDVVLAVDEVVTNIIVHGYNGEPGDIYIEIRDLGTSGLGSSDQPGGLAVVIKDNAPLFDPQTAPEPNLDLPLEQRQPGGLGIAFVRRLMDGMIYAPGINSGNELTLIKHCPGNGSGMDQS